jgi:hypothetical protein
VGHFVGGLQVFVVVLAAFPLVAAYARSASAEELARVPAPRLRVVWIDVLDSAPFAFPNATREASAILASAGVETEWTHGEASTVTDGDELKVVLMGGPARGAHLPERVMGGARRGAQSQTAWIYLSNVIWALGLQDRGSRGYSAREQEEIARALGRVVAHELVHAVAPDIPHSRTGLMADTMGRSLLLQRTLSLAPAEQAALRAGVAGPWSPVAAVSTPVGFTAVRR